MCIAVGQSPSARFQAPATAPLPLTVYWGPDATADLSTPDGVEKVYENLIREGTNDLQEALLNVGLPSRVCWPQLRLPKRCRDSWEARFPELAA